MPRRTDLESILLIGVGPIVIGQACEFDYSGTQACRVLRQEGYRVDPRQLEPGDDHDRPGVRRRAPTSSRSTLDILTKIIERERPDAVLPTLGGQTALNLAMELAERGVVGDGRRRAHRRQRRSHRDRRGPRAVQGGDERDRPRGARLGHRPTRSTRRMVVVERDRPAGHHPARLHPRRQGHRHRSDADEFAAIAAAGLDASPISEILIERSIAGWKEFELEVMRDRADNCVVVCSIENFDPMGVHTGDSITVAPAQTLSDVEYQRDARRRVRVHPAGRRRDRRVERAVRGRPHERRHGHHRDEPAVSAGRPRSRRRRPGSRSPRSPPASRSATRSTRSRTTSPRRRRPASSRRSTTSSPRCRAGRSRSFPARPACSARRCSRSARRWPSAARSPSRCRRRCARSSTGRLGLNCDPAEATYDSIDDEDLVARSRDRRRPTGRSSSRPRCAAASASSDSPRPPGSTRWFLDQIARIIEERARLEATGFAANGPAVVAARQAARVLRRPARLPVRCPRGRCTGRASRGRRRGHVQDRRHVRRGVRGEHAVPLLAPTRTRTRCVPPSGRRIVILGSGPNRIGQGIEFDYCCVHASFALRDAGYETVMVNCNPETVSTDYDTCDRLYFEPLTHEDVLNVIEAEQPIGVIVALGGQTPLKLAAVLPPELVLGTSAGVDRPRRGPRAVERAVRAARDPPAGRRHRDHGRRGARSRRADRLPGARAPDLRARRPGHGDRLRRRRARLRDGRARRRAEASGARAACRPSGRCSSTASSRTPPRSTSTPSATRPARC